MNQGTRKKQFMATIVTEIDKLSPANNFSKPENKFKLLGVNFDESEALI